MKKLLLPIAALVLAGCCCNKPCTTGACGDDPVIGNWSGTLPIASMPATSMIFERGENGEPKAFVLYRWGSPEWCKEVKICRKGFSFWHPYGHRYRGEIVGDTLYCFIAPCDKEGVVTGEWKPFKATRNPGICPCAKTSDAKFGEPIDLLKDGLNGWELMDAKAKNGWSFKDGVLSNKLGLKADGSWAGGGANLMTKRADFYDFNLEYDVRVPAKSNSGVYLRGRFECQVVDSYKGANDWENARHSMATYYGREAPIVRAEKPAGEWQHVSVTLYRRHITVVLNGQTIVDNAPVTGVTGGAIDADLFATGPIYLQGDHSDADYKNMILRPAL